MSVAEVAAKPTEERTHGRPLHVVQVSRDVQLLDPERGVEPWMRQRGYAERLAERRPGSRMTILLPGCDRTAGPRTEGGLVVVPLSRRAGGPRLFAALRRLDRERRIDVLTTQSPFADLWVALLFARFEGVRVVAQLHFDPFAAAFTEGRVAFVKRARLRLSLASLRWAHSIRVVSTEVERGIAERELHPRVSVVPVPIAIAAAGAPPSPPPAVPNVLYVGRLAAEKDLTTWLDVASRVATEVPDASFTIVGEGAGAAPLRDRVRALGLAERVRFAGFLPTTELPAVYRAATALLLTSRHEGFGRVLLEAAALGTPSVATRTAGASEVIVPGETGFVHAHGDVAGLAESIVRLIREPSLRMRLGGAAAARARHRFSPDAVRAAWVDLWIAAAGDERLPDRGSSRRIVDVALGGCLTGTRAERS
jgi:glycosyltransferase involved in cell wall biosynthesis